MEQSRLFKIVYQLLIKSGGLFQSKITNWIEATTEKFI